MIISRTPFRLSLFGGGTDYPSWFREHGGAVLAGTIDKYCYLTCRYLPPFFEHRYRVVYSKIEDVNAIEEIKHPAVRGVLDYLDVRRGVEIHHDGDLPARSGMGSSSSFTVGLLHALHALHGKMPTKQALAEEGIHVEREILKETVGCQDQISAAHGGFNHITFLPTGEYVLRPLTVPVTRIQDVSAHFMLFYTGIKRTASDVASAYVTNLEDNRRQLRIMGDMVEEAVNVIAGNGPLHDLGELQHEAWELKKSLGDGVSNPEVDDMYTAAREAGAIGGKLVGAGGGGFMLLYAPVDRQVDVRAALHDRLYVPFNFQPTGSEIIFYDPEQEYISEEERNNTQAYTTRELSPGSEIS